MDLTWHAERPPRWDAAKARIVGGQPPGTFGDAGLDGLSLGAPLPGDWFRVDRGDDAIGYGWLDTTWGEAEILLAVDPSERSDGVGTWVLERLEDEARARGLNYLFNAVSPDHPDGEAVTRWLRARGFTASEDGRSLRRKVARQP